MPDQPNVFHAFPLRSIAQKVQESIATDKVAIARPAREAREILTKLGDENCKAWDIKVSYKCCNTLYA
jgi:hypothetical protein